MNPLLTQPARGLKEMPGRLRRAGPGVVLALAAVLLAGPAMAPAHAANDPAPAADGAGPRIDLNRASEADILSLPVSKELAEAIYHYRVYNDLFRSVYDLFKVPGMTAPDFARIRPLVIVAPKFMVLQDAQEDDRLESIYDVVQRLLSQEGVSEGLVDEYIDMLRVPKNVNGMDYFDLTAIQNVAPQDAVAILKARREKPFETTQELRRTEGLSYYGYRNLRDYVRFDDGDSTTRFRPAGDYQLRVYNTPYQLDDHDILVDQLAGGTGAQLRNANDLRNFDKNSLAGRLFLDESRPYTTNKLRFRLGNEIKAGLLTHRNLGEAHLDETLKWYVGAENQKLGPVTIEHAYVGNYRLAFGHGLLMDNTDFFQSRRTGTGFSVRPEGVRGDISRSDESALKGGAVEASMGPLRATGFYSNDNKDAVLNPNGSFNRYITMVPRVDNATMNDIQDFVALADTSHFLPMRDVMNEKVTGGNMKFSFSPGNYIGVTAMEMKYKNNFDPDSAAQYFDPMPSSIYIDTGRIEPRDADIVMGYDNRKLGPFRDLVGAEGSAVYKNVSFQAEYGKLMTTPASSFLGRAFKNGPEAYIASAYWQYENFNLLALYRDFDEGYDNPYNRAFAETNRYDQTLVGDEFRLWNPLVSFLAENDPQSKAEKGFYFTTRYQVNRSLTINGLEYDNYTRKADNTAEQRITLSLEYRPIFPVRFRVRQRYSDRRGKGQDEVRNFHGWDSRYEARFFLSDYDRLEFLYSTTNVVFGPRSRLSWGPNQNTTAFGVRALPGQAFQGKFTHNFTPGLSGTFSSEIYDGFLWNFEDNEFLAYEGKGFRNWAMVRSRLSNELSWRLKYTVDNQLPITYVNYLQYSGGNYNPSGNNPDATNVKQTTNSFRFQLDYTFN